MVVSGGRKRGTVQENAGQGWITECAHTPHTTPHTETLPTVLRVQTGATVAIRTRGLTSETHTRENARKSIEAWDHVAPAAATVLRSAAPPLRWVAGWCPQSPCRGWRSKGAPEHPLPRCAPAASHAGRSERATRACRACRVIGLPTARPYAPPPPAHRPPVPQAHPPRLIPPG